MLSHFLSYVRQTHDMINVHPTTIIPQSYLQTGPITTKTELHN